MKALIKVGYACNENCTFCHTLDVRHIDGSALEVHRKIVRAKELGHTMVVLSGGEATIRPELFEWAAHAARLGMDLGLVTNGLLLAYPEVVERLLKLRLKYVYMSLHGGTAKIHNALVRTQTFDQARKALENLHGRGLELTINCVVTRQNVDHLRPLVDLLLDYPDLTLKFSMVQPKGGGDKHFATLAAPIAHAAAKVHEAITYGLQRVREGALRGPHFTHDGFPFCLLPGLEDRYDDLKTDRYWTMVEIGEDDFFPVDDRAKLQPEKCRGCAIRGACPGLYRGYHEAFGDAELAPVTDRPRSNSFNYVFESLVTDRATDACPLLGTPLGVTPWDRGRHLFVRNGPRLARFRTESRDFTDLEIEETKHGLGQVYLDASRKDAPDDFARDLVQLRRSDVCGPCPERDRCTGLFEPLFEDVFTRDDARVRALLESLEGDVLDLGCGEGPYEDVLAPLARAGRLRYTGVDPDPVRITALRERWPWAALEVSTGEALAEAPVARFDAALVLRSWNHLQDPGRAVDGLRRVLRPGGRLVVVDNVAFGLARMPAHARRAEGSRAAFEHYRNDSAHDAVPLLVARGFTVEERHDVGPGTSNQWLLVCRAPGGA